MVLGDATSEALRLRLEQAEVRANRLYEELTRERERHMMLRDALENVVDWLARGTHEHVDASGIIAECRCALDATVHGRVVSNDQSGDLAAIVMKRRYGQLGQ